MAKRPAKKARKKKLPETDDGIMDRLFTPKVRKELKKLAHENRPKQSKD